MMAVRSRQARVLLALLVSIAVGATILNVLGHTPPTAGAFCLSRYNRLAPVKEALRSRSAQYPGRWKRIEIDYSNCGPNKQATRGPDRDISQANFLGNSAGCEFAGCHFIICNDHIGLDGQIQSTEEWQRQWSVNGEPPNGTQSPAEDIQTIHISIMTSGDHDRPTDFRIRRTRELIELLCARFHMRSESVLYPNNWR
ncbi:MAG: peptidoglycan recognition protein family protein [Planctomycetota bacterium]|jgi:hypothetical protein